MIEIYGFKFRQTQRQKRVELARKIFSQKIATLLNLILG